MLRLLRIKNLALVEDLAWELGEGFTVLTGETGAGKSVVIGALSLVLGDRADKSLIRSGQDSCTVEAEWDLSQLASRKTVDQLLEEQGAEACEDNTLLLKRALSATGQNRQFINGSPVPLQLLKKVGECLADFHGPHDHQSLLSNDTQRDLLDAFAGHAPLVQSTRTTWQAWQQAKATLESIESDTKTSAQEIDLLRFQIDEIEKAAPEPGEDERVSGDFDRSRHAQRLMELTQQSAALLDEGEGAVLDQLGTLDRCLVELSGIDAQATPLLEMLSAAQATLAELSRDLSHYASRLDMDPGQAARIEQRYNLLQGLKKKYGPTLEDVLKHAEEGRTRLSRFTNRDEELAKARAAAQKAGAEFQVAAKSLSESRYKAATQLGKAITAQLHELGFSKSLFDVQCRPAPSPSVHGMDTIEFQFAPNVGEGAKPLKLIASSGEMARVMLAIKTTLAEQDQVPLLVFDEVDANVGGEIGTKVGRKLAALGKTHQVLCITHLPQVAALGVGHFEVRKTSREGRTFTELHRLDADARIEELARMLGGANSSARNLARTMLAESAR